MKGNVLVTGGAGYIGSVLVPQLLAEGHAVTVLDNFLYGQTSLLDVVHNPALTLVRGDVRDEKLLRTHLKDAEWIIPLACLVGAPACDRDPLMAQHVNHDAIQKIVAWRSPDQKILYPNTNSGYGLGKGDVYCDEKTPLEPISLYGRTKVDAERRILAAGNAVTFRLATVFGASPRMRLDLLVNDFVHRAVNDRFVILFEPHFKRNYIHVRDVSNAFVHAMKNFDTMKNEPYNVGLSDANLSKLELCEEIKKQIPQFVFLESPIGEDPDKRNYIISNAKIEATGFKPQVSLANGITELLKVFKIVRRNHFSNV